MVDIFLVVATAICGIRPQRVVQRGKIRTRVVSVLIYVFVCVDQCQDNKYL